MKNNLLVLLFVFLGCNEIDLPEGAPKCIETYIKTTGCLEKVYQYEYLGKNVYLLDYPCPEGCYMLLDENCNTANDLEGNPVCHCGLRGGFCTADFLTNRTNERLIWQRK